MAGIRLVEPQLMHLTLHYIGEADIEPMATALQTVAVPAFTMTLEGVKQFPPAGKAAILWVGVQDKPELQRLHAAIAAALAGTGFRPEARRYTPHLTLARCAPSVPASVVAGFLARHAAFSLAGVPVTAFVLFSSRVVDDARVYRRERTFPLLAADGIPAA